MFQAVLHLSDSTLIGLLASCESILYWLFMFVGFFFFALRSGQSSEVMMVFEVLIWGSNWTFNCWVSVGVLFIVCCFPLWILDRCDSVGCRKEWWFDRGKAERSSGKELYQEVELPGIEVPWEYGLLQSVFGRTKNKSREMGMKRLGWLRVFTKKWSS